MFFIACRWQAEKNSPTILGYAICSNADTPVTFIHADGSAYSGQDIWTYQLLHYRPWAEVTHG